MYEYEWTFNVFIQWGPRDKYMYQPTVLSLVQVMAWHLLGAKPLTEPMLTSCHLDP